MDVTDRALEQVIAAIGGTVTHLKVTRGALPAGEGILVETEGGQIEYFMDMSAYARVIFSVQSKRRSLQTALADVRRICLALVLAGGSVFDGGKILLAFPTGPAKRTKREESGAWIVSLPCAMTLELEGAA